MRMKNLLNEIVIIALVFGLTILSQVTLAQNYEVNPSCINKTLDDDLIKLEGIHLYAANGSNASNRVLLYLEERGIEYTYHKIDLVKSENLTDNYLRIHPKGMIPAIVHKGQAVFESSEILKYLVQEFPSQDFIPNNEKDVKLMWYYVNKAASEHLPLVVRCLCVQKSARPPKKKHEDYYKRLAPERYIIQKKYSGKISKKEREEVMEYVHGWLKELEGRLTSHEYLINDEYTIADIAWFGNIKLLNLYAGISLDSYPKLDAWLRKIESRPAYSKDIKFPNYPKWFLKFFFKVKRCFGTYYA